MQYCKIPSPPVLCSELQIIFLRIQSLLNDLVQKINGFYDQFGINFKVPIDIDFLMRIFTPAQLKIYWDKGQISKMFENRIRIIKNEQNQIAKYNQFIQNAKMKEQQSLKYKRVLKQTKMVQKSENYSLMQPNYQNPYPVQYTQRLQNQQPIKYFEKPQTNWSENCLKKYQNQPKPHKFSNFSHIPNPRDRHNRVLPITNFDVLLITYIRQQNQKGIYLSRAQIKQKALQFSRQYDFHIGQRWFRKFFKYYKTIKYKRSMVMGERKYFVKRSSKRRQKQTFQFVSNQNNKSQDYREAESESESEYEHEYSSSKYIYPSNSVSATENNPKNQNNDLKTSEAQKIQEKSLFNQPKLF